MLYMSNGYICSQSYTGFYYKEWLKLKGNGMVWIRHHDLHKPLDNCTGKRNYVFPQTHLSPHPSVPAMVHRMWLLENEKSPASRAGAWNRKRTAVKVRTCLQQAQCCRWFWRRVKAYLCLHWRENVPKSEGFIPSSCYYSLCKWKTNIIQLVFPKNIFLNGLVCDSSVDLPVHQVTLQGKARAAYVQLELPPGVPKESMVSNISTWAYDLALLHQYKLSTGLHSI
jgi:hypothetical protein